MPLRTTYALTNAMKNIKMPASATDHPGDVSPLRNSSAARRPRRLTSSAPSRAAVAGGVSAAWAFARVNQLEISSVTVVGLAFCLSEDSRALGLAGSGASPDENLRLFCTSHLRGLKPLRDEVVDSAGNAEFIRSAIDTGIVAAEIINGRRRIRSPIPGSWRSRDSWSLRLPNFKL